MKAGRVKRWSRGHSGLSSHTAQRLNLSKQNRAKAWNNVISPLLPPPHPCIFIELYYLQMLGKQKERAENTESERKELYFFFFTLARGRNLFICYRTVITVVTGHFNLNICNQKTISSTYKRLELKEHQVKCPSSVHDVFGKLGRFVCLLAFLTSEKAVSNKWNTFLNQLTKRLSVLRITGKNAS